MEVHHGTRREDTIRRHHKDCISLRTLDYIKKRRELKTKINQTRSERQRNRMRIEYAELNKAVKKSAREDKRQFMEELAETAEVAASKNEMRTVYKITQQICGNKQHKSIRVKDKQGNLLTSEQKQNQRWA